MDPGTGEAIVLGTAALAFASLLVFTVRNRFLKNTDSLAGVRSKDLLGIPERASTQRPKRIVSVVTSKPTKDSRLSKIESGPASEQVQPQIPIQEVEEEMSQVVDYTYKTCEVLCGSDTPILEFGAISDHSLDQDGIMQAISQPSEKNLTFKVGADDVVIAQSDIVDDNFDKDEPLEDLYDSINRVRIWSNNTLVFDKTVADFDPSGFNTEIEGILEDGTPVWIVPGPSTRVLFQEI